MGHENICLGTVVIHEWKRKEAADVSDRVVYSFAHHDLAPRL